VKYIRNTFGPLTVLLGLLALGPAEARSQVAWEAPLLLGPDAPSGLGIHLTDPEPGSGIGAMATWRAGTAPGGLGFRGGVAEDFDGDLTAFGGVDASGTILRADREVPVDILWVSGVGLGVGDHVLVSAPLGVSVGRTLRAEGIRFTPYVTPRLVLDAALGRDGPGDDLDLGLVVDLAADVDFDTSWTLRFGASVGDHEALSVGMVFPTR